MANPARIATATRSASMKGVAARYPAFDTTLGRPVDLEQRINLCRGERQNATPLPFESRELLALTAFIARQSRGMPIEHDDPRMQPVIASGRALFEGRAGPAQSVMRAVSQRQLGQGSSPAASSRRRIRPDIRSIGWNGRASARCSGGCATACSAYGPRLIPLGAPDAIALEAFLMWRARGMPMDAPAVRP